MSKMYRLSLLLALLLALLVACGGAGDEPAAEEGGETTQATEAPAESEETAEKPIIRLIENPWSASELNIEVARNLISTQLGYEVEVISLDENAQWAALAAGDADASLEVWPSGHAQNVIDYIDSGKVENGGELGPVGKIGWYIPSYLLTDHPELATWEGFQDPASAALFATAETGDKGQFLGGDPSFVQYDADIINNLGLNLEVVYAGSEEAILSQLDAAYSRQDPVLFYLWTPHSIHAKYELTQVALPDYSDDCYAEAASGGVACDYPADILFKIISPQLQEKAPDVYRFLKNFNYTTDDQIAMMAALELEGKTKEEAAQQWIDANEQVWKAWLP